MNRQDIETEFESFIEFPSDSKQYVTSVSTKLFAEHCVNKAIDKQAAEIELLREATGPTFDMRRGIAQRWLVKDEQQKAEIERLKAKVQELSDEAFTYSEQVEELSKAADLLRQDGWNTAHGDYILATDLEEYIAQVTEGEE